MTIRKRLAALSALALAAGAVGVLLPLTPAAAAAPAPVILNSATPTGADASWLETQNLTDGGHNRIVQSTMLVQHAEGRTITGVKVDANWNGSDDTAGAGTTTSGVFVDSYAPAAGDMQTSIVTARINVGNGPNFSGRAFNAPYRMRVVDSTGELSASVTATIRFVEEGQSTGSQDFPSLRSFTPGEATWVAPGAAVSFGAWQCDDPDVHIGFPLNTNDDECNRANQRWRRLDDGDTIGLAQYTGIGDNQNETVNTTAPSTPGHWVYELQFCNENGSCPNDGAGSGSNWWRIGKAVVNSAASSLTGSLTFGGANVKASTPPSVNKGEAVSADATVSDSGGLVQVIEWNKDHNAGASSTFEERFYTVPTSSSGNIGHPNISSVTGALSRTVSTSTAGLKTVQAKITDNGALDAGDINRAQLTFQSGQLRVNDPPLANNVSVSPNEDTVTTINLSGSDPDNQPAPLTYSVMTGLTPPSAGSLGAISGNQVTYTPAANFNGTATFTYRVQDGTASTVGAWTFSPTRTVTINVQAVNDPPVLDTPKSITTPEDNSGSVTMTATDVEGQNVTYVVLSGPAVGSASCNASTDVCTYTPPPNFFGSTSFVVRGTDTQGGTGTATVNVTVTPVNDAPVANSQGPVNVPEDATSFVITLSASDIDSTLLTFTAPFSDDVDHGTLSCLSPPACTYTPDANYNGPDSFDFRASDGTANSNVATVTINVTPINDAPVATDVPNATAPEDVPTPIAATGTDIDSPTPTVTAATDPANGGTTVTGPNEVTYTGDLNFHGIDTYDFTVSDGTLTDVGTVTVTVQPVNDAPILAPQTFEVDEDTPELLSIAAGDVDGDLLTWSVTGGAANGTVVGTGPDVVYVPDANWFGTDTFTVQVSDGDIEVETTMTVEVSPVNDRPAADAASVTTNEDESADVGLTGDDVDGDPLTFLMGSITPTKGSVSCSSVGACTYIPNPNANGADLFTFVVDDGDATDEASISIVIVPVNDDPVANPASVTTEEDEAVAVPLVASDIDGDALTFAYGTAGSGVVSGGGPDAVYAPNPNSNGADAFGFTVDDGHGGSDSAVATIQVDPVNDAPLATGGTATTPEDTDLDFTLGASDVEGDPLSFTVTTPPESGAVTCDAAGACEYVPADDFSGTITVGYEVSDGTGQGSGIYTILVDPVNDPPSPTGPGSLTTNEDTAVTFSLSADDAEDDELTYAVVSSPSGGQLVCSAIGSCTYTPASNATGTDSFTWSVSDGGPAVTSSTAIDVLPVNDAPQALDVSAETNEDTAVTFALLATDAEGDAITYSLEAFPGAGTVTISGNQATYTPSADYSGTDGFTYRATDPGGAFTVARASLVVNEVPLLSTNIVAEAVVARVTLSLNPALSVVVFDPMRATLRTTVGVPVVGRLLTFRIGNQVICSATTNAQGQAACGGGSATGVAALLSLGYQVSFGGDQDFSASSAKGPLIQVLSFKL